MDMCVQWQVGYSSWDPWALLQTLVVSLTLGHQAIRREESCTTLDAPIPERRFSQAAWRSGRVVGQKATALGSSQQIQRV